MQHSNKYYLMDYDLIVRKLLLPVISILCAQY